MNGSGSDSAGPCLVPTKAELVCRYCGKEFKRLAAHESRCPKRPTEELEAGQGVPVEGLSIALAGIYDLAAMRWGEHWHLTEAEASGLGAQWKPVFDAYFPSIADSKIMLLLFALTYSAALTMPRIQKTKKDKASERAEAGERSSHPVRSGSHGENNLPKVTA